MLFAALLLGHSTNDMIPDSRAHPESNFILPVVVLGVVMPPHFQKVLGRSVSVNGIMHKQIECIAKDKARQNAESSIAKYEPEHEEKQ